LNANVTPGTAHGDILTLFRLDKLLSVTFIHGKALTNGKLCLVFFREDSI